MRPTGGLSGPVEETVETTWGASSQAHNKGRVAQMVTLSGTAGPEKSGKLAFEYDALGRVVKQTRTIDGVNYVVEKAYDNAGYLRGMKYPDNDIIGQFGGSGTPLGYDAAGRLTSIFGILSSVTYNALGAPLVQVNTNSTTTTKTYDADRFWLRTINTSSPFGAVQDLTYTPNDAGMVLGVEAFGATPSSDDWTYEYDEMNRLKTSTNGISSNNQSWTYDQIGRIKTNSRVGTYAYPNDGPSAVRPHAPTSIAGGASFAYDGNGNLEIGGGRTMLWDANNRITSVTVGGGVATTFEYGPDGDRIQKKTGTSTVAKYPFGDDYEIAANGTVTKYFNAGFGVIAKKVGAASYWLHTDRLGSVTAVTLGEGLLALRRSYRSYGELFGDTGAHTESLGYIGQRTDSETGLTYLHARYYDSSLGMFLSPDPAGTDSNTYRYSGGDPAGRSDPSGLAPPPPGIPACGYGTGIYHNGVYTCPFGDVDPGWGWDDDFWLDEIMIDGISLRFLIGPTPIVRLPQEANPAPAGSATAVVGSAVGITGSLTSVAPETNGSVLVDFLTGDGETKRDYDQKHPRTREMQSSYGFERIRRAFESSGCSSRPFEMSTPQAFVDSMLNPFTSNPRTAPVQVGGYMTEATNNGDETVTYVIKNTAGAKSFLYHHPLVNDRAPGSTGPLRSITQTFTFTEPLPYGCR